MESYFSSIEENKSNENMFSVDPQNDPRKEKVDASIGMLYNYKGVIQELSLIRGLENEILDMKLDKEYSTLLGIPEVNSNVQKLFFGEKSLESPNYFCTQSITGGSALRIGGDILRKYLSNTIYVSNYTFSLYSNLFSQHEIKNYPYYCKDTNEFCFDKMISFFREIPDESVINIQLTSHNPTGFDLNKDQWILLAEVFKSKNHFAFFDCAYLGYGTGSIDGDLTGIHVFIQNDLEFFIAYSSAKSTLNYSDDTGFLLGFLNDPDVVTNIKGNLAILNRGMFSFTSLYGARILNLTITKGRQEWEKEIESIYLRIRQTRKTIENELGRRNICSKLLKMISNQTGNYLFLNLNNEQLDSLRTNYAVYLCDHGRVNLSSLNDSNISYFIDSICKVLNKS